MVWFVLYATCSLLRLSNPWHDISLSEPRKNQHDTHLAFQSFQLRRLRRIQFVRWRAPCWQFWMRRGLGQRQAEQRVAFFHWIGHLRSFLYLYVCNPFDPNTDPGPPQKEHLSGGSFQVQMLGFNGKAFLLGVPENHQWCGRVRSHGAPPKLVASMRTTGRTWKLDQLQAWLR